MTKRDRPLQAGTGVGVGGGAGAGAVPAPAGGAVGSGSGRVQRLADGVRQLRTGQGALRFEERGLLLLGGILAPLGLVAILVGWSGAARTPNLFEQIPYAISGGLFGLGLVFLGSFLYFAHWMTQLVKEHRAQSAAVVDAIARLEEALRAGAGAGAVGAAVAGPGVVETTATTASNGVVLVATEKGTMAHRADCVVVAGKAGLRPVAAGEALAPCKLCDPSAVAVN